nr:tumor necrosis factor receptor superfamily, member a [Misgurnus anguillicaudatus]
MDKSTTMKVTVVLFCALNLGIHGAAEIGFMGELQNRTARQLNCLENHEYPHNGFCCKNCEAGTYVSEKCTTNQEKGTCTPCKTGTYAEHPTGMEQCLQCSQCHRDQIVVAECTSMSNTKCECKPGFYCLPDEPCEVCKKCIRCKDDEEVVSPCTATSNAKCRRRTSDPTEEPSGQPTPASDSGPIVAVVVVTLLILVLLVVLILGFFWKKRQRRQSETDELNEVKVPIDVRCPKSEEEQENSRNAGLERTEVERPESRPLLSQETQETSKSMPVEDDDRGLGDSLPNTTSSSQTSLSAIPLNMCNGDSPQPSPPAQRQPMRETEACSQDDGPLRKLVPLLGEEESLRKSFDLFDALDVRILNKFFRSIGVSDNSIKMAETQNPEDKVYNLLQVWMQKEGLRADINTLLQSLLDMNQRYSAEQIVSKALEKGFYRCE